MWNKTLVHSPAVPPIEVVDGLTLVASAPFLVGRSLTVEFKGNLTGYEDSMRPGATSDLIVAKVKLGAGVEARQVVANVGAQSFHFDLQSIKSHEVSVGKGKYRVTLLDARNASSAQMPRFEWDFLIEAV